MLMTNQFIYGLWISNSNILSMISVIIYYIYEIIDYYDDKFSMANKLTIG